MADFFATTKPLIGENAANNDVDNDDDDDDIDGSTSAKEGFVDLRKAKEKLSARFVAIRKFKHVSRSLNIAIGRIVAGELRVGSRFFILPDGIAAVVKVGCFRFVFPIDVFLTVHSVH